MKAASSILVVALMALPTLAAEPVSSFSALPPGDELHIHYVTRGCFHLRTTDFRFRRAPEPRMAVVRVEPRLRDDPPDFKRLTTGTLSFRVEELAGLDRLLQVYRSKPTFGSTTKHEVAITQLRDGRVIASERFQHFGPHRNARDLPTFDKLSRDIGGARP